MKARFHLFSHLKDNSIFSIIQILFASRNNHTDNPSELCNEKNICLFIKNYNLETLDSKGNVNPITSLICTILLEISSMERHTIIERMASGRDQYIAKCRATGKKMGRPSTYRKSDDTMREQYKKEISLLKQGISLRNIHAITSTSISTIRKLYRFAQ